MARWSAAAAGAATLLLLAGCASATSGSDGSPGERTAVEPLTRDVRCWSHGFTINLDSYAEVLPNTLFAVGRSDDEPEPVTPLVVVGHVVEVSAGRAWAPGPNSISSDGTEVPFDHPRALWKTVHAEVAVDEVLADPEDADRSSVTVQFTLNGYEDLAAAEAQLVDGQRLVLPLYQWAGTDYRPDMWSVGTGGAPLVAEVDDEGRLSLPCAPDGEEERLLRDTSTLGQLRAAVDDPVRVRHVRPLLIA